MRSLDLATVNTPATWSLQTPTRSDHLDQRMTSAVRHYRVLLDTSTTLDALRGDADPADHHRIHYDNDVRILLVHLAGKHLPAGAARAEAIAQLEAPGTAGPVEPEHLLIARWQACRQELDRDIAELGGVEHLLTREREAQLAIDALAHSVESFAAELNSIRQERERLDQDNMAMADLLDRICPHATPATATMGTEAHPSL